MKGVDLMWYDITGNEEGIEYQILDTSNTTHIKVRGLQLLRAQTAALLKCLVRLEGDSGLLRLCPLCCACCTSI